MKILVTGSKGFVAGYLIEKLLELGHEVVGVDNLSKYGDIKKSFDNNKKYKFIEGDAKNTDLLRDLIGDCDHIINLAAMIGGVSFFHDYAFDLMVENDLINISCFKAAIEGFKKGKLKKITVISTSMIYDKSVNKPAKEGDELLCPLAGSSYAFHKL